MEINIKQFQVHASIAKVAATLVIINKLVFHVLQAGISLPLFQRFAIYATHILILLWETP